MKVSLELVQPRPQPLGWYIRCGYNDHQALARFIEGGGRPAGVVLLPEHSERHESLRGHLRNSGIETILEPHSLEQGFTEANRRNVIQRLPWRTTKAHSSRDLAGIKGARYVRLIADAVATYAYDAVLAPSHYLSHGFDDPWFRRDLVLTARLRRDLDRRGLRDVRIYYRLAAPAGLLRDNPKQALSLAAQLSLLDIDAVWLLLHPFGDSSSGVVSIRGYLQTARALHRVGRPVVAERVGAVGLLLEALGAVGATCSGLAYGEQFDAGAFSAPPGLGGFGAPSRVYLRSLMASLLAGDAKKLFDKPHLRALHVCARRCCPNGVSDTLRDPALHYAVQREGETAHLSSTPSSQRAAVYMTEILTPATRFLVSASSSEPKLRRSLERCVSWGIAADGWLNSQGPTDYSLPVLGERHHRRPASQSLRVVDNSAG